MSPRHYAVDLYGDENLFDTADEARACAQAALDEARDEAQGGDGWPRETDGVCWGDIASSGRRVVREWVVATARHEHSEACAPEPDPEDPEGEDYHLLDCREGYGMHHDFWTEYELVPVWSVQ